MTSVADSGAGPQTDTHFRDPPAQAPALTARSAGLVACTSCGRVHRPDEPVCVRCGSALSSRDRKSLQKVWAWLVAGLICYVPANIYTMMRTSMFGYELDSTIVGGVIDLIEYQSYSVAVIVFFASVMIPIGKFIAIAFLAYSVHNPAILGGRARQRLYDVVEFIGRWSMIDVFVVAILSSLVQFNFIATINPGIAAVSFALSVAFTMLSAQSFDSRLIWDADEIADA
ncbi:paraquat-inducible protein A [Sedimentitalea sp. JM2-8]|uniref:Paraquat-inducible protein A n=1 Tax=Sedimentitalea xiamensis TaxID=3050037 RepID=A0ABT7FGY4_9RHOB|nr:paraquat-inducible protein A [Sedimentitalea xiamensis]MDK3074387.1 paraquat-inducible protein A [Sedimentitalea xiamensis]